MYHLSLHPTLRTCSADSHRIKELYRCIDYTSVTVSIFLELFYTTGILSQQTCHRIAEGKYITNNEFIIIISAGWTVLIIIPVLITSYLSKQWFMKDNQTRKYEKWNIKEIVDGEFNYDCDAPPSYRTKCLAMLFINYKENKTEFKRCLIIY